MKNKKAELKGPGTETSKNIELPDCVVIHTEKDSIDFKNFVSTVVEATNKNALDIIAHFVEKQNIAMAELVRKLGAK